MGKYISDVTIKEMINADMKIKDANILVLGVTFKENCPDMRNTKVVDIIEELKTFGCAVDVHDPWVDPQENKRHYSHGIISDPFHSDKKYDAIIVAVAHEQFVQLSKEDYQKISTKEPLIIDIKGIVDDPTWRL
jgi:UDP-N-acetyl-D-galactosamine dehydrogenase